MRGLYRRITAFAKASKGKRYRPDVLAFGANLEDELFQLQFTIHEPKPRLVRAADLRDSSASGSVLERWDSLLPSQHRIPHRTPSKSSIHRETLGLKPTN